MKKCVYCDSFCENDNTVCPRCGAAEFILLCPNCGTEIKNGTECPSCGVRADAEGVLCPACGNRYYTGKCSCGYTPGTDAPKTETVTRTVYVEREPAKKKRGCLATCGLVLLWICFLPVMALIAVWRKKSFSRLTKIVLTVIIVLLTLLMALTEETEDVTFTGAPEPAVYEVSPSAAPSLS